MAKAEQTRRLSRTDQEINAENRSLMEENGVVLLNVIGEPGAGKTTLLEKLLPLVTNRLSVALITGNDKDARDVSTLASLGIEVVRIDTRRAEGPDLVEINEILRRLPLDNLDVVVLEDIAKMGSGAELNLGDALTVVVAGVDDGMDLPAKYPEAFRKASVVVVNKTDLLSSLEFSLGAFVEQLVGLNDTLKIFPVSALNGEGMVELSSSVGTMVWKKRRNLAA